MGLLKTLFFILFFYYAFKFIARLFAPYLMNKMADKMKQRAEQHFGKYENQNQNTVKEGETIIDKAPTNKSKTNDKVGEYVDFEEIE